ncbi:hypothetical protein [Streptomyces rapamycinicus]|nr:hypothetical protein [Streptomyces rapamycinicus]UTO63287.1 hypothetical protein LJB45_13775 [Streptomyces rapamycinicus]UTP31245.1 hypothetical protein LIV37_18890 [Streptomyces rapamycinicus NRRL 5491]
MELARQLTWSEQQGRLFHYRLANLLGDRFVAGYVLYTGQQTLPFGGRIRALPMDALWQLSP